MLPKTRERDGGGRAQTRERGATADVEVNGQIEADASAAWLIHVNATEVWWAPEHGGIVRQSIAALGPGD